MDAALYARAFGIGVAIAAPVGPMSLLAMRRTLARGFAPGIATGFGIATGDGIYACVAALGLAGVSHFLLLHDRALHLIAGTFLLYLGLRTALARGEPGTSRGRIDVSWTAAYASSTFLTLTNPPTIVMFAAAFTAIAPRGGFVLTAALTTVAGVFCGSLAWWLALVTSISAVRHTVADAARLWIDRVAGGVLALFGLAELRRALPFP